MAKANPFLALIFGGLVMAAHVGCQRQEEIRRYRVVKPEVLAEINRKQAPPPKAESAPRSAAGIATPAGKSTTAGKVGGSDRTLAAIVPHGPKLWFFKLAGPTADVSKHAGEFDTFLQSVRFAEDEGANPQSTVPDGWTVRGPSGMRYATFVIGAGTDTGGPPLELTVIALSRPPGDLDKAILDNVQRWRKELGLPPTTGNASQPDGTTTVKLQGATATVVDLTGHRAANTSMGQPPFFKGGGDGK